MKAIAGTLFLVLGLAATACTDRAEADRLRADLTGRLNAATEELETVRDELAASDAALRNAEQKLAAAEKDARYWRREAGKMTARVERADRTIALYEDCVDDIIYAYNSSTYAIELPRAISAALNDSNCSALGYYAT